MHTAHSNIDFQVQTSLTGFTNLPPNESDTYGCLLLQIHGDTETLNGVVAVADKSPDHILAAELHLGPPGQNGPLLMSLGTGVNFTNIDQNSSLHLRDVPIPQNIMTQVRLGNVYAVVRTVEYPNGEIRGQIAATPISFSNLQISNGVLTATLDGLAAGETIVVQSSSNLQDWSSIQTNTASGPSLQLTNSFNPVIPVLFLRACAQ